MRPHGSGSSPCSVSIVYSSPEKSSPASSIIQRSPPFFRGKWDPDTLFFTCLINCQTAECPRCLDAQVHSRLCPLDSRCKIRGSYLLSHDFFCFHLYPLHVFIRHFRFQKCLFVSSRLRLLQSTHMQTVTGFCRCFAFQIGKICHLHVFIRHFRFQKCLFVSSRLRFYFFRQIVQIHPAVHLFFQKSFVFPLFPL